jgi:hypothetical protein
MVLQSLAKIPSNSTTAPGGKPVTIGVKNNTFACGKGNYPNHLIKALQERGNWSQVAEEVGIDTCNFLWRQLNLNFQSYDQLDNRI